MASDSHGSTPLSAVRASRGRVLAEPRLSPDGERVSLLVRTWGRTELVLVPSAGGPETVVSGDPDPVGAHPTGGGTHTWSPDGRAILYLARGGGLALVPTSGGPPRALALDGVGGLGGELAGPDLAPDGRRVVLTVDGRRVVVAGLDPPQGLAELTGDDPPAFALDPCWSPDGRLVAWVEWDVPDMPWDSSRVVVAEVGGGARAVVAGGPGVSCQQPRWSPGGALGFVCDRSGWANLWVLTAAEVRRCLDAPAPGAGPGRPLVDEAHEHAEPAWGPGQRSWAWSPDGSAVAFCRNEAGFGRLCLADLSTGRVRGVSRAWHHGLSWRARRLVAIRSGGRTATQAVALEMAGGDAPAPRTTLVRGPVAGLEEGMVEPESVEWAGEDGITVHGRLYRPAGATSARPTIVWIHGGPTGQMAVTFNPRVGFFTSRGWAVLAPDYRGSTGWGRAYTQALRNRWGDIDVADTAAGMRAAVARGWSLPGSTVVMGASAGAFTALLVMAAHPELCAAGVDLYGVADLLDLKERTHRYEAHYTHHLVGPLPGAEELHRSRSPLAAASSIRCPLLVLHGADDEVVPVDQSRALADAVRAAGGTVELHVYEGEGHGWSRPETTADELGRIGDFLRRHVGWPPG